MNRPRRIKFVRLRNQHYDLIENNRIKLVIFSKCGKQVKQPLVGNERNVCGAVRMGKKNSTNECGKMRLKLQSKRKRMQGRMC